MHRHLMGGLLALLFSFTTARAHHGYMDSPAPDAFVSGIGFISGWRCDAGTITVSLNGGPPQWVSYNQPRADTRKVCGDEDNGFLLQINWNHLGDGRHTAVLYDDGVEFLRSSFTVVTPGVKFIWREQGGCSVPDFPAPGETGHFAWSQATQHLELVDITPHAPEPPPDEAVQGQCGSSRDTCAAGRYEPIKSSPQSRYHLWGCVGSGGHRVECKVEKTSTTPVHGECSYLLGGGRTGGCLEGRYRDVTDTATHYRWQCIGTQGGRTVDCEMSKPTEPPVSPFAQFEGRWTFSSNITRNCSLVSGRGEMGVHRGRLSGWFQQNETVRTGPGTYRRNFRYTIGGNVSETGVVNGRFEWSDGSWTDGWFTGTLSEWSGSGTWEDTAGCVGNWTARKQAQ